MSQYAARMRPGGRWEYTNEDKRLGVYAIGYCAGWRDISREERKRIYLSDREWARMLEHRAKYHANGHASRAEAEACHRIYLVDHALVLDGEHAEAAPCAACGETTHRFARVGERAMFYLCDAHRVREVVVRLFAEALATADAA